MIVNVKTYPDALSMGVDMVSDFVQQRVMFQKGITVFFYREGGHNIENNNGLGVGIYGTNDPRDMIIAGAYLLRKAKERGALPEEIIEVITSIGRPNA